MSGGLYISSSLSSGIVNDPASGDVSVGRARSRQVLPIFMLYRNKTAILFDKQGR